MIAIIKVMLFAGLVWSAFNWGYYVAMVDAGFRGWAKAPNDRNRVAELARRTRKLRGAAWTTVVVSAIGLPLFVFW